MLLSKNARCCFCIFFERDRCLHKRAGGGGKLFSVRLPLSFAAYSHCAACTLGSLRAWQSPMSLPGIRLSKSSLRVRSRLGIVSLFHVLWCDVLCHTVHTGPCLCSMGALTLHSAFLDLWLSTWEDWRPHISTWLENVDETDLHHLGRLRIPSTLINHIPAEEKHHLRWRVAWH